MKILVAGDFCPMNRVAAAFSHGNFGSILGEVKKVIGKTNYAIVNFECPVCNGQEKPISKCGPNLKCNESGLDAVKWAGFNCVTLANNHFLDYGDSAVCNTLDLCKRKGLDYVGGGVNLKEADKTLYVEVGKKTIAIINCCEHEFSIATALSGGSNPLNVIQQYYAIKEARQKADHVIVIVHGGHELFQLPSLRMQDTYRFFVDTGADAVINHHQHCYSGFEIYEGKPIVYGLGNLCFDEKGMLPDMWYNGMMAILDIGEKSIDLHLLSYCQCKGQPTIQFLKAADKEAFDSRLRELNEIIADRNKLELAVCDYYKRCARRSATIFEPWLNRYFNGLQARCLLPSFISRRRALKLYGQLFCQAHRDKIEYYLQEKYQQNK